MPLNNAGKLATDFTDPESNEVLHRHFDREDLQTQLYPIASHTLTVDLVTPINQVDALELEPHALSFMAQSKPVHVSTSNGASIGYQAQIPAWSDFAPYLPTSDFTRHHDPHH